MPGTDLGWRYSSGIAAPECADTSRLGRLECEHYYMGRECPRLEYCGDQTTEPPHGRAPDASGPNISDGGTRSPRSQPKLICHRSVMIVREAKSDLRPCSEIGYQRG